MHQLPAHAPIFARMVSPLPRRRLRHHRRAHAGVRFFGQTSERRGGREAARRDVAGRARRPFAIWKRYGNTIWPHEYLYDQERTTGRERLPARAAIRRPKREFRRCSRARNPQLEAAARHGAAAAGQLRQARRGLLPADCRNCSSGTARIANASRFWQSRRRIRNYADDGIEPAGRRASTCKDTGTMTQEAAVSGENNGYLALRYHAIQVVAVLSRRTAARFAPT